VPSTVPVIPAGTLRYPRSEYSILPHSRLLTRILPPPTSPVRTSVGARPHVVVEGEAVAKAAEDVDGAGGVDHGRVRISAIPRRAVPYERVGHACGTWANNKHTQTRTGSVRPTRYK
jgi:hypothetical protein